jgi:hypothetical protein
MLLSFLEIGGAHGDMFLINGGKATMASYGLNPNSPSAIDAHRVIP